MMNTLIHINDEHIDTAEILDIIVSMYSLIEYIPNYSRISGRFWQFKRDEPSVTDAGNVVMFLQINYNRLNVNQVF